jgi:streptomycin 6-kinase
MVGVPEVVRNKALTFGAVEWLDSLPQLIEGLERDWVITVGDPFPSATEAFVAAATVQGGTPAVLKLIMPRDFDAARNELAVLRVANGDGCVALLRHDLSRGALLLEHLGPSLFDLDLPIEHRHEILCATALRIWQPATGLELPTGAEKGRWLIDQITSGWHELGQPCSERAIDHAVACAERRVAAHDDERAVLVHGDVHQWNALQAASGYKLVDPDGLLAEAEYDLGIIMREDPLELLAGDPWDRAHWLAHRTDLDATAIWEWGAVERVSTGLLGLRVGLEPVASQMLEVADRIAS